MDTSLVLNTKKAKELIVDFRKTKDPTPFISVGWKLSVMLALCFSLRSPLGLSTTLAMARKINFYYCTIKRILISGITEWSGNCSVSS